MSQKKLTYDKAMMELQQILAELQDQQVSIDELSTKVQRASELIAFCKEKLRSVKEETEQLFDES